MKKLGYFGCIVAFYLLNIKYGPLIVLSNILIWMICTLILIYMVKAKGIDMDWMYDMNPRVFAILSIFRIGPIIALYNFYKFYKYPITRNYTEEEFEQKLLSDKRNKRLRKLGI